MPASVQLQLRVVSPGDHDFINTLYFFTRDDLQCLAADPVLSHSIAPLISMQQHAQAASYRANYPDAEYLVIEKDRLPVGRVVVQGDASVLRLVDISVLPQARGQGCAGETIRRLQQRAASDGQEMRLTVRLSNTGARRLYAAHGFEIASQDAQNGQMRWRP